MAEKKRFSDFAEEPNILDGEKVSIETILNEEIEILGHRIAASKYSKNTSGKCLTVQFQRLNGERRVVFTGSDVLIAQLERYSAEIPFYATIKKVHRYYTLA